jgi:hypothetical protein
MESYIIHIVSTSMTMYIHGSPILSLTEQLMNVQTVSWSRDASVHGTELGDRNWVDMKGLNRSLSQIISTPPSHECLSLFLQSSVSMPTFNTAT